MFERPPEGGLLSFCDGEWAGRPRSAFWDAPFEFFALLCLRLIFLLRSLRGEYPPCLACALVVLCSPLRLLRAENEGRHARNWAKFIKWECAWPRIGKVFNCAEFS